ncbi:A32-like packaging ATPase [Tupanvirus deep ocean]|uniref:A32-like packaging ATPase n=2 Tax=Tupanvirus TaxID=2094720 RepID=A0AC62A731_9VIRU|nr:A32-like packaging ATPase [Tupanvirus deep ocean]QKU33531.1 A32-like packaging ATPase [Tupanvirus deep ocean]
MSPSYCNNKFQIHEFKLENMTARPSILIIGKNGSGKYLFQKDIIHHFRNVPGGAVITSSDKMNSFYKHFFTDLYVHHSMTESILKKIKFRQCVMIEKEKNNKEYDASAILIIDNCLSNNDLLDDNDIFEILLNSRGYKLTFVLNVDSAYDLSSDFIMNFDYVFLLNDNDKNNKIVLWDNLKNILPTYESFEKVFSICTQNYGAMVIDTKKICDNPMEKIYWFRAKNEQSEFIFGSEKFIDLHKKYYDTEYIEKSTKKLLPSTYDKSINDNKCIELPQDDYMFGYFVDKNKINFNGLPDFCNKNETISTTKSYSEIDSECEVEDPKLIETYSNDTSKINKLSNTNTDDLFDYFMNEDNYFMNEDNTKVNNDNVKNQFDTFSEISIESEKNEIIGNKYTDNEFIKLEYLDDDYELNAKITNLNNHKLIEILCNHITNLKLMKNKK